MKKIFTIIILSLFIANAFGQINMEDSTAQVIGYWNIGDKESYNVSLQKIKLKETDTISNELMTYEIDVTVIDSAANSYSIEWFYYNYKTNSTNEIVKKMTSLSADLRVVIETDEYGAIRGIKNWKEVRDYLKKSVSQIKNDFKDIPNMDKLLKQIEGMYTSKAAIESTSIKDAQQFYTYHGGKYLLEELLVLSMQLPNIYNPKTPFDAKTTVHLDELNPEENNFIIRSSQEVDSDQLTNTTFEYMKKMAKTLKTKEPKKEEIGTLTNVTTIASRIHGTGWPIYSILTKTVNTMDVTNIEERIIEIK
jgi:hypothetical protein